MYSKLNAKQQAKRASSAARPDVCKIIANLNGSQSEVRSYQIGEPVFASMTLEYPGPFALWDFHPGSEDGVYTIRNVGLNHFIVARDGTLVVAPGGDPTEFRVQPADGNFVLIKLKNEDQVWTVPEGNIRQNVILQEASGSIEQKFIQEVLDN